MEGKLQQLISPIPMDPGQFLEQPREQDLGQLLPIQPSDPHRDRVISQASEASSLPNSDTSATELLNSSHSSLVTPPTPTLAPSPKRRGKPQTKELAKERPPVKDSPESRPEDTCCQERGSRRKRGKVEDEERTERRDGGSRE